MQSYRRQNRGSCDASCASTVRPCFLRMPRRVCPNCLSLSNPRRLCCLADKPHRHFVERSELVQAAAAALSEERLRQASLAALLQRAADSVDFRSDALLVSGYLCTILGLPLAVACLCLTPSNANQHQEDEQATQPPWVRLHPWAIGRHLVQERFLRETPRIRLWHRYLCTECEQAHPELISRCFQTHLPHRIRSIRGVYPVPVRTCSTG